MRKLIGTLVLIAALVGGVAIYLAATTPKTAPPLRFPLSDSQRSLLAFVPASADAFALIPAAALLHAKLSANAVTGESLLRWEEEHELPSPWMLGGADVVAWKRDKKTSYVVRLDGFRALLVRTWMLMASNASAHWEGSTLVMNEIEPAEPSTDLEDLLRLASGLPPGDAFLVQRHKAKGAFPPIARPAVTSVRVAPSEIVIVSRAATDDVPPPIPVHARFPKGALLSVTFAEPHRIIGDLNRLLGGVKIESLVRNGGSIVLYDVDTGKLLPRPNGVVVIPATPEARAAMEDVVHVAELVGETRDTGKEIEVSFDRTSLGLYSKDSFVPATWPATRWAIRIDPARLVPILRRLSDSRGLQFLTPNVHRGVRDLRRWIDAVQGAESIEADASVAAGVEELRVRIASK